MLAFVISAALAMAPNSTPYSDARPPDVFQGDAVMTLELTSQQRIDATCEQMFGKPPPGLHTEACVTPKRVIMPNPCTFPDTDTYAHLLCHELGHVNGWPPTHGDFQGTPVSRPIEAPAAAPPKQTSAATGER